MGRFTSLPRANEYDIDAVTARLEAVASAATVAESVDGLEWYARYNARLVSDSAITGVPVAQLAACFSALSPQTPLPRNERAYGEHLTAYVTGQVRPRTETLYIASDKKARAILDWQDASIIGNGPKTQAFARNLQLEAFTEGGEPIVTIDSITFQAATGRVPFRVNTTPYRVISNAIAALARRYGTLPYQLQALLWVTYRNG